MISLIRIKKRVKTFFTYYIRHRIHRKQYAEMHRLGEENARLKREVRRNQFGPSPDPRLQFGPPKAVKLSDKDSARQNLIFTEDELPPIDDLLLRRMWQETMPIILPPPEHHLSDKYIAGADPISSGKNSLGVDPFFPPRQRENIFYLGPKQLDQITKALKPKPQTDEYGHLDMDGTIAHDAELDTSSSDNSSHSDNLNKPEKE